MKALALILFLASPSYAQWRAVRVSSNTDTAAITENFRRASMWSNRKLDRFSSDTVYGQPVFHNGIKFLDSTIQTTAFTTTSTYTYTAVSSGPGLHEPGDFKWKISISSSCGTAWLRADGTSKSTVTYSALFAQMGYSFGGSGANFTMPDMTNGEFIRALSTGTAGGNLTLGMGTKQTDSVISHSHTADIWSTNNVVLSAGGNQIAAGRTSTVTTGQTPAGATETRPRNYAMIPCIYSGVP